MPYRSIDFPSGSFPVILQADCGLGLLARFAARFAPLIER